MKKIPLSKTGLPQKVLTYLCVKNGNTWTASRLGYTYAVFHSDSEMGLLDWDLTREAKDGDLLDLINLKKVEPKPVNNATNTLK